MSELENDIVYKTCVPTGVELKDFYKATYYKGPGYGARNKAIFL